jgi:hypothetical protein
MHKTFSSLAVSSQLSVTYRPIDELIPDPRNARTHPKRQIEQARFWQRRNVLDHLPSYQ